MFVCVEYFLLRRSEVVWVQYLRTSKVHSETYREMTVSKCSVFAIPYCLFPSCQLKTVAVPSAVSDNGSIQTQPATLIF